MNIRTLIPLILLSLTVLIGQKLKTRVNPQINSLDFSRFPKIDLYVTFLDKLGKPMAENEFAISNFVLNENGQTRKISEKIKLIDLKAQGQAELYIALVFDNSFSMNNRIGMLETAAHQFIDSLQVGDYAAILDFGNDRIKTRIREYGEKLYFRVRQPFSVSKQILHSKVKTPGLSTRTYMYDSILGGLSLLAKENALGRKALIVFSDGEDVGSVLNASELTAFIKQFEIPIYAIDLNQRENKTLKNLARESRGEYFFVSKADQITGLYQEILKFLKSQYRITYTNPNNILNSNQYIINLSLRDPYVGKNSKRFVIEGERISFRNILYRESQGLENLDDYIAYISNYPSSKNVDLIKLHLARFWYQRGRLPDSYGLIENILRNSDPEVRDQALILKADVLKDLKRYHESQEAYKLVIRSGADSKAKARAMLELANSYSSEGNFEMALNTYQELSQSYEGTDFASNALFNSASLSMEMGNLDAAEEQLNNLVSTYENSKSTDYAQFQLAQIKEQKGSAEEAKSLYADVIKGSGDNDLKNSSRLNLANLLIGEGAFSEAGDLLTPLLAGGASSFASLDAEKAMIAAQLGMGNLGRAATQYKELPVETQSQLLSENHLYPINRETLTGVGLANGAALLGSQTSEINNVKQPIKSLSWPEMSAKFAIVGPLYQLASPSTMAMAIVPMPELSKLQHDQILQDGGIFRFEKGMWVPTDAKWDQNENAFVLPKPANGVYAMMSEKPRVVRLYNIYFDLGKSRIKKDAEKNLFVIVDDLKALPDIHLEIAGHTDSTGSETNNIELSLARADAIKRFLVSNGIQPDRLESKGYGSQYPVYPNTTSEGREKNRRTEFTVISTTKYGFGEKLQKEQFLVILHSFTNLKTAFEKRKFYKLRDVNTKLVTNEKDGKKVYRIYIGPFPKKEDAQKALEAFRKQFLLQDAQIVTAG